MNHFQIMLHVVLPQVARNVLPATGNQLIMNIKDTAVLNVIGVTELFFQTKSISGNNFRYFESFFVACVLYFIMTFTASRILLYVEKRLDGPDAYQKNKRSRIGDAQMAVIKIEHLSKSFGRNQVLKDVNFKWKRGGSLFNWLLWLW